MNEAQDKEREFWLAARSALVMILRDPGQWRRALLMIVRGIEKRYELEPAQVPKV